MSRPKHLSRAYAEQFMDRSVVAAYEHRPPIPAEVFEVLESLIGASRTVLDAGCGTGAVARRLAPLVERVDAVDFSEAMIAAGKRLPGGDHPNLRWTFGEAESAPLDPPYSLIVAAGSLHWMEWSVVMPRFREALAPDGTLAIVWQSEGRNPWSEELTRLIQKHSTNRDYRPLRLVEELTERGLFDRRGEHRTAPTSFSQSIQSYVESVHSRNGFSRERMSPGEAAAFDEAVERLLRESCSDGIVQLEVTGHVVWGDPAPQAS